MIYGSETRPMLVDVRLKFERTEIQMIRWTCGVSMKDRRINEELRMLAGVEPITTVIRSGRPGWYGYLMRKSDEDWVKKCMEFRVEGRRPVGRPIRTWLESVEVDMADLEVDKEDDRKKWIRNVMRGPTEGACTMAVPAMSTRPRTIALRMPSTHPAIRNANHR